MNIFVREREWGILLRMLGSYAAWLAMVFVDVPAFASICIVIAAPLVFGSVIWHLWRSHALSAVNQIAFAGAVAFFPFLTIQIWATRL
jgi:hypothetical protein